MKTRLLHLGFTLALTLATVAALAWIPVPATAPARTAALNAIEGSPAN